MTENRIPAEDTSAVRQSVRVSYTDPSREGKSFRSVSQLIQSTLSLAASRRGFAERRILIEWPQIVGQRLACLALPIRIDFGGRESGILVIGVHGAASSEVAHMAEVIVQRVNTYYGWKALEGIRLDQSRPPPDSRPIERPQKRQEIDPEEMLEVTRCVEDKGLRHALTALGLAIAGRTARNKGSLLPLARRRD